MSIATFQQYNDRQLLQLELETLEHRCVLSTCCCVTDCGLPDDSQNPPPAYAPLSVTDGLISAALEDYRTAVDGADVLHDTLTAAAMPEVTVVSFEDFSRMVIWSSVDPGNSGIFFQRLDLEGNALDAAGQLAAVDSLTTSAVPVAAATLESGNLAVSWNDAAGLKLAIYTPDGNVIAAPFLVGNGFAIDASEFDVISTHGNNIVVAWFNATNSAIEVQYFDDVGNPFGPELPLFSVAAGNSPNNYDWSTTATTTSASFGLKPTAPCRMNTSSPVSLATWPNLRSRSQLSRAQTRLIWRPPKSRRSSPQFTRRTKAAFMILWSDFGTSRERSRIR